MLTKQLPPFGYGDIHVSVIQKKVVDFFSFFFFDLQIYCVFPV